MSALGIVHKVVLGTATKCGLLIFPFCHILRSFTMRRFATRYVPSPFALVFKELPIAVLVTCRVGNSKPVALLILTEQWLMVEQDTFGLA